MSNRRYEVKFNFQPLKVEIGQKAIFGHNSNIFLQKNFVTKKRFGVLF